MYTKRAHVDSVITSMSLATGQIFRRFGYLVSFYDDEISPFLLRISQYSLMGKLPPIPSQHRADYLSFLQLQRGDTSLHVFFKQLHISQSISTMTQYIFGRTYSSKRKFFPLTTVFYMYIRKELMFKINNSFFGNLFKPPDGLFCIKVQGAR
jgi:hypothetical protein